MTDTSYPARSGPEMIAISDTARPEGARSRIAWSAIFAGVVLVIATELLLNSLGAGIGLGLINPASGDTPNAGSLGAGTGIWILLSTVIAFVVGGYVAGRLADPPSRFDGMLHGLTLWGVTLLLTLWLLGSAASNLIGGAFHLAGGAASLAGKGVVAAAPTVEGATGVTPSAIEDELQNYMGPSVADPAAMSREDAQKAIAAELPNLAAGGAKAAAAKERIVPIMAAQQHITPEEATRRLDADQARFEQDRTEAVAKAKQAAQASAHAVSTASFLTFGALLIGAVAAAIGGGMAAPRPAITATRRVR